MKPELLLRLRSLLVTLWLGLILTLAFLAAPTAFALLERSVAGSLAGALFKAEAHVALGASVLLYLIERRQAWRVPVSGQGDGGGRSNRGMSLNLLLVLGALFCTVLGYFALQPMMASARAGQGSYSFGMLHGVSSGLFALKGLLLALLAWRCTVPAERA